MIGALPPLTLVLGGVRSGKSAHAERLITDRHAAATYVATGEVRDAEMAERVRRHRARRGSGWTVVEEPLELARAVAAHAAPDRPLLVDSLTLWLANLIERDRDPEAEAERLLAVLAAGAGPVVLVADEVGLGGIAANALQRRFADAAGRLNQRLAAVADHVVLVAAGLPLALKGGGAN